MTDADNELPEEFSSLLRDSTVMLPQDSYVFDLVAASYRPIAKATIVSGNDSVVDDLLFQLPAKARVANDPPDRRLLTKAPAAALRVADRREASAVRFLRMAG
jgi:hypothetical protein